MARTLSVNLIGSDGLAAPRDALETLYASDLHFGPVRRRSEIASDGCIEIEIPDEPAALHALMEAPGFGRTWATADNCGNGYAPSDGPVEFVRDAAAGRLRDLDAIVQNVDFSLNGRTHRDAAAEYLDLADRVSARAGEFHLKALGQALLAGEYAAVERARRRIAAADAREEFLFGCNALQYRREGPYAEYFRQAFNFATLPFYLKRLEPKRDEPDYSKVDRTLEFCRDAGITPKGHPLWWGHPQGSPDWLAGADWSTIQSQCERVVARSVRRYRDSIHTWDVINEAHDWANIFKLTQRQEVELTRLCCETARANNPAATLVVNNCICFGEYAADGRVPFGAPIHEKIFTPLSYTRALVEAGVDFDAIGIQLYFPTRDMLAIEKLLDEFAAFGKKIHITELGVRSVPVNSAAKQPEQVARSGGTWRGPWNESIQADWLEWFYTLAYSRPEVEAITWWDLQDPGFIPTSGLLSEDEIPKEAYFRLRTLRKQLAGGEIVR